MNSNYGYQLYQAERPRTRAAVLAEDAHRGRQAAAVTRERHALARKARQARTSLTAAFRLTSPLRADWP
ncbi:MAG TPA: hypothetical protein VHU92_19875 [Streptosporangiaceae bacterium]|jgi:hypothetical protein|nr:hypothetical protein [Streptosporangiaceae bacterium]